MNDDERQLVTRLRFYLWVCGGLNLVGLVAAVAIRGSGAVPEDAMALSSAFGFPVAIALLVAMVPAAIVLRRGSSISARVRAVGLLPAGFPILAWLILEGMLSLR